MSSVFSFAFFHSFARFGWARQDDDCPASSTPQSSSSSTMRASSFQSRVSSLVFAQGLRGGDYDSGTSKSKYIGGGGSSGGIFRFICNTSADVSRKP
jgi:hypothetical protein